MEEFANQIREEKYNNVLDYEEEWKMEAVPVIDEGGDTHIIFYNKEFNETNFEIVKDVFIDGTFKSRPNIKDCMQLLTVLGVLSNRVSGNFLIFFTL